ncbi:uncharacterized protein [Halyomorpha halys]|uniref:uncharacterized protein n=1 Tax=Halyomorpha halys TaxID=286706 RepID=UPI0006D4CC93|nr:laccase-4 [Halyomorpha halys]
MAQLSLGIALVLVAAVSASAGNIPKFLKDSKTGKDVVVTDGADCYRKCDGNPKTCYFKLNIERYSVLGGACRNCSSGVTEDCLQPQCVTADGYYRHMLTINRALPGPKLQVCRNDTVVADVINMMPDESTSIHFHGVSQKGSQYYDGVPYVTQCPISPGQTFRYIFEADMAGTFYYHSHTGIQKMDGLTGAFIVRDLESAEDPDKMYDEDLPEHTILISDWSHIPGEGFIPGFNTPDIKQVPVTFLFNGRGRHHDKAKVLPLAEFKVEQGKRYRFRLLGSTCMTCPVVLQFESHTITAITSDGGQGFKPISVNSVLINSGDRFDVIIKADQPSARYKVIATSLTDFCDGLEQVAYLTYNDSKEIAHLAEVVEKESIDYGVMLNAGMRTCGSKHICLHHLEGDTDAPAIGDRPYATFNISFGYYLYEEDDLFKEGTYQHYDESVQGERLKSVVNNISFSAPPSPVLSQLSDIPASALCKDECYSPSIQKACSCPNLYNIPLGAVVDIIIYDDGLKGVPSSFDHPFHLHGYVFYILDMGLFKEGFENREKEVGEMSAKLHEDGIDLKGKPLKDTISVPAGGYVIIRFFADNPGYWLYHCHFAYHLETGMAALFKVGEDTDFPPVPKGFPKCANFLPTTL